MEEFADEILRESASRANRGKPPLAYRQMRERWRDTTEKKKYQQTSTQKPATQTASGNAGAVARGGKAGGKTGRGGAQIRGTTAKFGGNAVCFLYNSRKGGCPRTAKPGGCDDGRGGLYAYVCNFETGPGQHCLAVHPRHANH